MSPRLSRLTSALAATAVCAMGTAVIAVPTAHADAVDDIGKKLVKLENQAAILTRGIRRPKKTGSRSAASRRLIDAQVAFGIGNFDDAALMLYDLVEKYPTSPSYAEALYYLAEALYQKGDSVASRSFFMKLVATQSSSKFYQQSLERLVELSLRISDPKVTDWLTALDQVPEGKRRASIPYVRGKYNFYSKRYVDAINSFVKVPQTSKYYFQARYFIGASYLARKELGKALKEYQRLITLTTKTKDDTRVVELTHMALGRLHYERDQPSKAIDQYLKIDRKSPTFDIALFEVAWVYVKSKQFNKALRALELLAIADPTSAKMPQVRILEGNLRIRKARLLHDTNEGNPTEQYGKAIKVFDTMKKTFDGPYKELSKLLDARTDVSIFMAQITGRSSKTFDTDATIPPVAAAWVRDEPDVKRVIAIESDLAQIGTEIDGSEKTILRLEKAMNSSTRVRIFPSLSDKQTRGVEVLEDIHKLRLRLSTHERHRMRRYLTAPEKAQLDLLQAKRQNIARELSKLPHAKLAYGDRIQASKGDYTNLEQKTARIAVVINQTEAVLVALERYEQSRAKAGATSKETAAIQASILKYRGEVNSMKTELTGIRRETTLARDAAGTGDTVAARARRLRSELHLALDAEHRYMQRVTSRMNGRDAQKARQIASLTARSNQIVSKIATMNKLINTIVDTALDTVRSDLRAEKGRLAAYKREFLTYEAESHVLGGRILGASFATVKKKFYDVIVKSDIGVIDVTWSQKEAADGTTKKLVLDKERELHTLGTEFRDIIKAEQAKKAGSGGTDSSSPATDSKSTDGASSGDKTNDSKDAGGAKGELK